ncbi:MAG: hypothetical protein AB1640_25075 [bacterium]
MQKGTYYGALNARFLTPEEVARKFVPLPSFSRLVREDHAVLMGPRGCGKTTLLKMLTRGALRSWQLSGRDLKYPDSFRIPEYESIYIPSDVRWLHEVRDVDALRAFDPDLQTLAQRVMIAASVINETANAFKVIVEDVSGGDAAKRKCEVLVCESLINLWGIENAIPSFRDLENGIEDLIVRLRGILNSNDPPRLRDYLQELPSILYAHSLDAAIRSCKCATPMLPEDMRPKKWAICYDELEIGPQWLHSELLSSLRSIDQAFFLKLTWNPILPQAATAPEPGADFTVIRLWNSHVKDPLPFCEKVTAAFLGERFPQICVTPDHFLGYSIFASDEERLDEYEYRKDSNVYRAMKNLATKDSSFRNALIDRNVSPTHPAPSADPAVKEKQMDEFFRKAKPIVLLRQAFLREEGGRRTRKSVTLYAGKQAVFAVSEGNPRWLLGLLNDLCDIGDWSGKTRPSEYRVPYTLQAKVINAASRRFNALIKATPVAGDRPPGRRSVSLNGLVDGVARLFSEELYGRQFPLDPIGSFRILGEIDRTVETAIGRALEIGALVHIGRSTMDVAAKVVGERFRLSFMICPTYKLPLRNYRCVTLTAQGMDNTVQRRRGREGTLLNQLPLRFSGDEDTENI